MSSVGICSGEAGGFVGLSRALVVLCERHLFFLQQPMPVLGIALQVLFVTYDAQIRQLTD